MTLKSPRINIPYLGLRDGKTGGLNPPGAGPLVYDTFTDANGVLLPNHTPDIDTVGGGWSNGFGTHDIQSNTGHVVTVSGGLSAGVIDAGQADIQLTVRGQIGTGFQRFYAVIRYLNSGNYWWVAALAAGANSFRLVETTGFAQNVRASAVVTINTGVWYTIVVIVSGQTITATLDGGNQIQYNAAAAGEFRTIHGFGGSANTAYFDEFEIVGV